MASELSNIAKERDKLIAEINDATLMTFAPKTATGGLDAEKQQVKELTALSEELKQTQKVGDEFDKREQAIREQIDLFRMSADEAEQVKLVRKIESLETETPESDRPLIVQNEIAALRNKLRTIKELTAARNELAGAKKIDAIEFEISTAKMTPDEKEIAALKNANATEAEIDAVKRLQQAKKEAQEETQLKSKAEQVRNGLKTEQQVMEEHLDELDKLKERGLISEKEYQAEKQRLLNSGEDRKLGFAKRGSREAIDALRRTRDATAPVNRIGDRLKPARKSAKASRKEKTEDRRGADKIASTKKAEAKSSDERIAKLLSEQLGELQEQGASVKEQTKSLKMIAATSGDTL